MSKSKTVLDHEAKLTTTIGPAEHVFAEDGTDLTQIRQMLAMSPTQRVLSIQSLARSIVQFKHTIRVEENLHADTHAPRRPSRGLGCP